MIHDIFLYRSEDNAALCIRRLGPGFLCLLGLGAKLIDLGGRHCRHVAKKLQRGGIKALQPAGLLLVDQRDGPSSRLGFDAIIIDLGGFQSNALADVRYGMGDVLEKEGERMPDGQPHNETNDEGNRKGGQDRVWDTRQISSI